MKKSLRVLMLTAVLAIACTMPVMAQRTGKVKADAAVIRSDADTKSNAIASTTQGTSLEIKGEKKDANGTVWYEISVDGGTGYIRSDLVDAQPAEGGSQNQTSDNTQNTQSSQNTQSAVTPASGTAYMIPGSSNIRNAAVTGDVLVTLQKDDAVTITGELTGSDGKKWYQVSFVKNSKSYTGYVRSDLITTTAPAGAQQSQQTQDNTATQTQQPAAEQEQPAAEQPAQSAAATLKSLTLSVGDLTPEFTPDCVSYTINAPQDTVEIAVSAVAGEEGTQITAVDGFSDLKPGLNAGAITVTGADGGINIYSFSIICGEVGMTGEEETEPEVDPQEIKQALDEVEETVPVEEYEKYKQLANRRLIYMCVLGFALALCVVILINLLLKVKDLNDELEMGMDEEDDDDDDEEQLHRPVATANGSRAAAKSLKKVDAAAKKKIDETSTLPTADELEAEKPKRKSIFEKPQYTTLEPTAGTDTGNILSGAPLREVVEPQQSYTEDESAQTATQLYEGEDDDDNGVDDDFEFEFINLK